MPSFKDHLNAFKLACEAAERDVDVSSLQVPAHYDLSLKRAFYDGAVSEIGAMLTTTVSLFVDNQLEQNEVNYPAVRLRCPDEAVSVYLEHVMAEVSEPIEEGSRSRSLERIAGKLEKRLSLNFSLKSKSDAEHDASDLGARAGTKLFIDKILPDIVRTYAEKFPPQDHPYGQRDVNYFSPPPMLM